MLPEKYRRLWQRRLRRRPLLPFVVAAYAAVDFAGAFVTQHSYFAPFIAAGLTAAQVGLLGLWVIHAQRGWAARGLVVLGLTTFGLLLSGNFSLRTAQDAYENPAGIISAFTYATLAADVLGSSVMRLLQYRKTLRKGEIGPRPSWPKRLSTWLTIMTLVACYMGLSIGAEWSVLSYGGLWFVVLINMLCVMGVFFVFKKQGLKPERLVLGLFCLLSVVGVGLLSGELIPSYAIYVTAMTVTLWLLEARHPNEPRPVDPPVEPEPAGPIDLVA